MVKITGKHHVAFFGAIALFMFPISVWPYVKQKEWAEFNTAMRKQMGHDDPTERDKLQRGMRIWSDPFTKRPDKPDQNNE